MGKTGTAQKYDENGKIATGKYISSFIGTYPANNPQYVLVICINEPSAGAYYGGVVAKPVGQRIFTNIFETKTMQPENYEQTNIVPNIEMPYLVGMSIADACVELKKLGLMANFETEGTVVIEQQPPKGTKLYLGEIVFLIVK